MRCFAEIFRAAGVLAVLQVGMGLAQAPAQAQQHHLIDAHIHYSHDAWGRLPPQEAIAVLKNAGISKAFVSSSSDEGTQMLYEQAPEMIVPVLRPYRKRGELGTWIHDETVVSMLKNLLQQNTYAGIGEFHVFGKDVGLPVVREVVKLASKHEIFLHAHSDAEAIDGIFEQDPDAVVLWAHAGFIGPAELRVYLKKYDRLYADLAFRTGFAVNGMVRPAWRALFAEFPDRFLIGTDTYTPERWYFVDQHAEWTRQWLSDLPDQLADRIAYQNAENLLATALGQ